MATAYCANCDKALRGKDSMILYGWGICKQCQNLERRPWDALKEHIPYGGKIRDKITRAILAELREE